jgi:hypothetical protein
VWCQRGILTNKWGLTEDVFIPLAIYRSIYSSDRKK